MEQRISFCTRPDGVRIAYAVAGEGSPLVVTAWGDVETEWRDRKVRGFYESLAQDHTVIRFDIHGTGLSDRERTEMTVASDVADLRAVVDQLALERFALFGVTAATPTAIAFAAEYPERLTHLVLFGACANGATMGSQDVRDSILSLVRSNFRLGAKLFAEVVASGDSACEQFCIDVVPKMATQHAFADLLELVYGCDLTDMLPRVTTPTLVMHREGDRAQPLRMGREAAAGISGARFVVFEGRTNRPEFGDVEPVLATIREFLGDQPSASTSRSLSGRAPTADGQIGYLRRPDGAEIAYSTWGSGTPVVWMPPHPISHLELEWTVPVQGAVNGALSSRFRLVRFDPRGIGLSKRDVSDFSLEARVGDLEAVVDRLGLDRVVLVGADTTTSAAVSYAVAHPERVSSLVLLNPYVRQSDFVNAPQTSALGKMLFEDWEIFSESIGGLAFGFDKPEARTYGAFYRACVERDTLIELLGAMYREAIDDLLPRVASPTLVVRHRDLQMVTLDMTREVVSAIPDATFLQVDGRYADSVDEWANAISAFIGETDEEAAPSLWRDRYESLGVAGEGGQGSVLRARDHQHDRLVALKVRAAGAGVERSALLSEARILLNLSPHPGLPLVRDDFFVDEQYVVVMDWVEGTDLRTLLDHQGDPGLPVGSVIAYLAEVAQALDHLHSHEPPIVHGDVKPANIILNAKGRAVLVDFGIATTGEGRVAGSGTRGFVAPEVAAGAKPTPSSDVFSLAATAYALLTGRSLEAEWEDPEGIGGGELRALGRAIRRGLSVDPSRRPRTAGDFVERLRAWREIDLPTGTVTFLLTDVEGSTPLWESHTQAMPRVLARHEQIVADAVESHNGRFIKSRGEGDSTLSVFVKASDAMSAAIAMQRALHAEHWPDGIELRVRAALHTGEAELREGDYYGPTINRAARIRGVASGGEVVLSQTTMQVVADSLPRDVELVDHGTHALRGLARQEQVYRLEIPDLAAPLAAPMRVAEPDRAPGPVDLPVPRTSFIGREREVTDVIGLLSGARLVTLTGPGGSGKTRLAIEVAQLEASRHSDGVFFVDLAPVATPDGVVRAVASAVNAQGDSSDLAAMVVGFLSDRAALIVLDNCEHVIDASAQLVDRFLAACPTLTVLATSREPLQLDGEQIFRVPTLDADDEASDAVRLFIDRASTIKPDFAITAANRADVLAICRHLDGIPLAVELAAGRVDYLGLADIASRLSERFSLLVGGGRGRAQRQQTLQAAIDWSWDLLDDLEKEALRRLAVFAGPFTLEAAEGICGARADAIASLAAKSLVTVERGAEPVRYRLLETMRVYANDRLTEAGEEESLRNAHRDWYLAWSESFADEDFFEARRANRFINEHDNIRAGMDRSTAQNRSDLFARQMIAVATAWGYQPALQKETKLGLLEIARDERLSLATRADAHALLAIVSMVIGEIREIRSHATRSVELDSSDRRYYPLALWLSGRLQDAGEVARRLGQPSFARLCRTAGAGRMILTDAAGALRTLEAVAAELDPDTSGWDRIFTYISLVAAKLIRGDETARDDARSLRAAFARFDDSSLGGFHSYADVLEAMTLAQIGRLAESRDLHRSASRRALRGGFPGIENECLLALAYITYREGDALRAATMLEPLAKNAVARMWPMASVLYWLTNELNTTLATSRVESPLPDVATMRATAAGLSAGTKVYDGAARARIVETVRREIAEEAPVPAIPQAPVRPSTLPAERTSFIGRERELSEIRAFLASSRLVTLTGPGGSGKTRLAIKVAQLEASRFSDGAFFVDLASFSDPEKVLAAIAGAVNAQGDSRDLEAMLLGYLSDRRSLIVLDNCEHVIEACADVADLLVTSCPSITILATSREALRVQDEQTFAVPPLGMDDERSEAVRLFTSRAASVASGFALNDANRADVLAICRRLDGIPLAIELAAGRVSHLGVADIARGLDEGLGVLVGRRGRRAERQQTLRATMDWSWNLLESTEQTMLRRLAVFAGPFTAEGAEAVCRVGSTVELLGSLVAKSLVVAQRTEPTSYRLLETVRAYGLERLTDAGEADATRDAHRDWYLSVCERRSLDELFEPPTVNRFKADHTNFRAALTWSMEPGQRELYARLVLQLAIPWSFVAVLQDEAREGLRVIADDESVPPPVRADAFGLLAHVSALCGDLTAVRPAAVRSLELHSGDRPFLPIALLWAGKVAEASELAQSRGQRAVARYCRTWAANRALWVDPDSTDARATLAQIASGIDPETCGWDGNCYIGRTLCGLIDGDLDTAAEAARCARVYFGRHVDTVSNWLPDVLDTMVLAGRGRFEEARSLLRAGTRHVLRDGLPIMKNDCLISLAYIARCEGELHRAATLLEPVVRDGSARSLPMYALLHWLIRDVNAGLAQRGEPSPLPTVEACLAHIAEISGGRLSPDPADAARINAILTQFVEDAALEGAESIEDRSPQTPDLPPALQTRADTPFVGRTADRATLDTAWNGGHPTSRLVVVAGEPGAGKTRLASEFARSAHDAGATVLFGRCDDGLAVPFQPFVEALKSYANGSAEPSLGPLAAELTRLVPELAGRVDGEPLKADPETEQYRLFEAVREWLEAASNETPIVLVLDDLHWATPTTLLMLRHVVRSDAGGRILIVGTYRDTEPGALAEVHADLERAGAETITLTGLSPAAVAELVSEADDASAIHEASSGNPFFVGELMRHRAESGTIVVPEGARMVVRQRLSRLTDDARDALAVAAVIGEEFELSILDRCVPGADEILEPSLEAHIIREVAGRGLRYRFAHALVRSAITNELPAAKRARLHQRVGEAIESVHAGSTDDHVAVLAEHFDAAADLVGAEKAIGYLMRAGEEALKRYANEDAVSFFTRTLDLIDSNDTVARADVQIALGEAQLRAGDPRSRDTLLEAAQHSPDPERVARALIATVRGFSLVGEQDREKVAAMERALSALPIADSVTRSLLLASLALELVDPDEHERRETLGDEAIAMARRIGDANVLSRVLVYRFQWIGAPDRLADRLETIRELDAIASDANDPDLRCRAAAHAYHAFIRAGEPDIADRYLEENERLSAELRQPIRRFVSAGTRGTRERTHGRFENAERLATEMLELGRSSGQPDAILYFGSHLFGIRFEQGRLGEVEGLYTNALERSGGNPIVAAMVALIHCELGEDDSARTILRRAEGDRFHVPEGGHVSSEILVLYAITAARLGERAAATQLVELLAPYEDQIETGPVSWWGSISHTLGMLETTLDRFDAAEAHFSEALAVHERCGSPNWVARTRAECAEMLRRRGRPDDLDRARDMAKEALATAEELGMSRVAAQARELLRVPLPSSLAPRDGLPFVGRAAERAAIDGVWNDGDATSRLVLIAGEPGAGKTRLAAEFAREAHAHGATVLFGRCDDGLAVPFQPFVEALSHYVKYSTEPALGPLAAELTRVVPELGGEPLIADPETEQYRLFEAVREWLHAASADTPIVLVLDDLHWATRPTLLMLRHVLRSETGARFLIVGTYRDTEPGALAHVLTDLTRVGAEPVALSGLDVDDVAQLVEDPATAASVHEATAGNAFFIEEVIRHGTDAGGATTIPVAAWQLVTQRLSRLSDGAREALTQAAVAGEEFELAVLAAVLDDVDASVDEAIAAHLVREVPGPGLRYRFAHALVRSAIEDDLTAARRARLHLRIGEAIETVHSSAIDDHLPALARHWLEAAPLGEVAKAVDYAKRAGDRAKTNLALDDAASWFGRALGVMDLDPTATDEVLRCDLLIAQGDVLHWAGDDTHRALLIDAAERARALGDSKRIGRAALALVWPGGYGAGAGRLDRQLVAFAEEALAGLAPTDENDGLRAELLAALAMELVMAPSREDRERATVLNNEAVDLAGRIDDPKVLGRVATSHIYAGGDPDRLEERLRLATQLAEIGTERGDVESAVRGRFLMFEALVESGDLIAAAAVLDDAERLAISLRHPLYTYLVSIRRVAQDLLAGRLDSAERIAGEASELGQIVGYGNSGIGIGMIQLAQVRWQQGRAEEAIDPMELIVQTLRSREPLVWKALMQAYAGETDACRRTVDALDAHPPLQRNWLWLPTLVQEALTVAEIADTERAPYLYEQLLPYAERNTWAGAVSWGPVSLALALLAATLGRLDDADMHFRTSSELCEGMGALPWLARTRCEWAAMLRRRGRSDDLVRARELAAQALATAEELGMARVAAQAREVLVALVGES